MLLGNRRQKQEEARKCVAEFVNSDPDDLVFVQNATTGKSDSLQFKTLK
jgi:selenocysteine lyase/cysteine desulfurase